MVKILVFISEGFYYVSHRRDLLEGLQKIGYNVILVTNIGLLKDEICGSGIKCIPVDIGRKSLGVFSLLKASQEYRIIIKSIKPDLIFAVAWKPILAVLIGTTLFSKVPVLCAFAGLGSAFVESRRSTGVILARFAIEMLLKHMLNRSGVHSLFQNNDDRKLFLDKTWTTQKSSSVISGAGIPLNGVRKELWPTDAPTRFLFAGRLLRDKGISVLINACTILKQNGFRFECAIAGFTDASNRSSITEEEIQRFHKIGIIKWIGAQKDVMMNMVASDCFVFPTMYREGVPRVLLEASAVGIPIITTDMPGCRDVVEPYKNGIIIPPGDAIALASAMEYCINNRSILKQWGSYARKKAEEKYSIEIVIKSHVEIIYGMLGLKI